MPDLIADKIKREAIRTMYHDTDPIGYVAVVLMDGFSALSLGAIVEPFSYLSRNYPEIAPKLILYGLDGHQVWSQSRVKVTCDEASDALLVRLSHGRAPARIILCGPTDARTVEDRGLMSVLRFAKRCGASICSIGGATWQMAETGLLDGRAITVHWSSRAAFSERYDDVETRDTLFELSCKTASCAGETATLDMVLDLIAGISPIAAEQTANHLLVSYPRAGMATQPGSRANRLRGLPTLLSDAIGVMADHIEDPLQADAIAARCDVSVRKLERLFQQYLGTSPMQYYKQFRTEHAHDLVTQSDMPILDIAVATGFSSTGALRKMFKRHFNLTPSQMRDRVEITARV